MNIINLGSRVVNIYLIEISKGYLLVDTGYPENYRMFMERLRKRGIEPGDIKFIFLTHAHDDHAGFLGELLQVTNAPVILHPKAIPALKRGQNSFTGGCTTRFAWFSCQIMKLLGKGEHRFPPLDQRFDPRLIVLDAVNQKSLEEQIGAVILETPGHTSCSISLMFPDGSLFCGDAAMNGIPSSHRVTIWVENLKEFEQSWRWILKHGPAKIYPGHGKPFSPRELARFLPKLKTHKLYSI